MDSNLIKKVLDYSKDSLSGLTNSQRDIYTGIDRKIENFLKNGGLNIILLTGLRGTGKSTILKTIANKYNQIYTSGDLMQTNSISISDITGLIKSENGKMVIIDEVLYLSDWNLDLKISSDSNQKILFIISASSAMQLNRISQDLARRMDIYKIQPLLFREFLRIKHNIILDENNLIGDFFRKSLNEELFIELVKLKNTLPANINALFKEYYSIQFPYLLQEHSINEKIKQMVEKVIYKDLPQIDNFYSEHLRNADLILKFLTTNEKTSYLNISRNLGISKDTVTKIVGLIEDSNLITMVGDINPTRELRGNKKILFSVPSIRIALSGISDSTVGFAREDMFSFIIRSKGYDLRYNYAQDGYDYLVNNTMFEIGNKNKKLKQNTIVVSDSFDIDYNKDRNILYIPMYLLSLI